MPSSPPQGHRIDTERIFDISFVIDQIKKNQPFSSFKLNHGFWELCANMRAAFKQIHGTDQDIADEDWQALVEQFKPPWPSDFFLELKQDFATTFFYPRLFPLVSPFGWRNCWNVERTPAVGVAACTHEIRAFFGEHTHVYDGLVWKDAIYDGELGQFLAVIRPKPVLVVGPPYVEHFGAFAQLEHSAFIAIDPHRAAWSRHQTLEDMTAALHDLGDSGVVCLMETGGANTSWLIRRMHERFPQSFFLSLGQALNVCNFARMENVNWFLAHRDAVFRTVVQANPAWIDDRRAYEIGPDASPEDVGLYRQAITRGLHRTAYKQLRDTLQNARMQSNRAEPCPFIENKKPDFALVQEILEISEKNHHYANFGPVSRLLEETTAEIARVPNTSTVVMCRSATVALHTLVRLYAYLAERPLRWVTSAFGFFSSNIGPLENALVLDCDARGLLDIDQLKAVSPQDWDGLVLTNPFGLYDDFSAYQELCDAQGKVLVVDNALALFCPNRREIHTGGEAVSFHQTKPWGMGEGGCAIIPARHEHTFRCLLNFGVSLDPRARPYASNGKISDFDCAFILSRLLTLPRWERLYYLQARRISLLAAQAGLRPLGPVNGINGHIPYLGPRPIAHQALQNDFLVLRKYYKPLAQAAEATRLYDHIVNIPCHPEVAGVDETDLRQVFESLVHG